MCPGTETRKSDPPLENVARRLHRGGPGDQRSDGEQVRTPATPLSQGGRDTATAAERGDRSLASRADAAVPEETPRPVVQPCSLPTATPAARLDLAGRGSMWDVSSVFVTKSHVRGRPGAESSGAVVLCHSGGVSVWVLTERSAVCTHLSPALAGETREKLRVSLDAAVVVDPREHAEETLAPTGDQSGVEICIVAGGRHKVDPGPPVVRVWHGFWRGSRVQAFEGAAEDGHVPIMPAILTVTLKRRLQGFFPPVAPRDVKVRLCVCGYSAAQRGPEGCVGEERCRGEITAVLALGVKAVRLVFSAGRKGQEEIKAKALPCPGVGDAGENRCKFTKGLDSGACRALLAHGTQT